jgi:hypothetical protein
MAFCLATCAVSMKAAALFVLLVAGALLSGCSIVAEEWAMKPYDRAMQTGRMSPSEYNRKLAETREMADRLDGPWSTRSSRR